MAVLTIQEITHDGLDTPTYDAAAAGGDSVVVADPSRSFLHIKNGDASPVVVTVAGQVQSNQEQTNNNAVTVPATDETMISLARWEVDAALNVDLTYASVTTLTVGVFHRA